MRHLAGGSGPYLQHGACAPRLLRQQARRAAPALALVRRPQLRLQVRRLQQQLQRQLALPRSAPAVRQARSKVCP